MILAARCWALFAASTLNKTDLIIAPVKFDIVDYGPNDRALINRQSGELVSVWLEQWPLWSTRKYSICEPLRPKLSS